MNINEILGMIETLQITPEEGYRLIQEIQQGVSGVALDAALEGPALMYYGSEWEPRTIANATGVSGQCLLFDTDEVRFAALQGRYSAEFTLVKPGSGFRALGNRVYEINPASHADYNQLVEALQAADVVPDHILHMWSNERFDSDEQVLRTHMERGFDSLFYLAKALHEHCPKQAVKLLYMYLDAGEAEQPQYEGVSGIVKTLRIENHRFICKAVGLPQSSDWIAAAVQELQGGHDDVEVRYANEERFVKIWKPYDTRPVAGQPLPLKKQGVYLITGGAGGLGLLFAEYLAKQVQARLVLTGRSDLAPDKARKLQELEALGAQVRYVQADISQKSDVDRLIETSVAEFDRIDGVIHSAGVIRDAFVVQKDKQDADAVLAPKVYGTVHLDEATKHLDLDFFVLFSSLAGAMGNVGQCDYATGNSFMDHFAKRRAQRTSGRSVSINWPLWEHGGMNISEEERQILFSHTGLHILPNSEGLTAWEEVLRLDTQQCIVAYGDIGKAGRFFNPDRSAAEVTQHSVPVQVEVDAALLQEKAADYVTGLFSEILRLPAEKIDLAETFQTYGIDSIAISQFNYKTEQEVGALPKTLMFEVQTFRELAEYLVDNYRDSLVKHFGLGAAPVQAKQEPLAPAPARVAPTPRVAPSSRKSKSRTSRASTTSAQSRAEVADGDIAIIGLSGRYPNAANVEEFWQALKSGQDCITEIPASRWDWRRYYDPNPNKAKEGKMYSKWGGFLDDADKFDPMFFNILPREAELMDPQERLFLEVSWSALEDAGYTRQQLREMTGKQKSANVGVFAGVTTTSYNLNGAEEWRKGNMIMPNSSAWSLANRVSFVFNFNGPSLPVDTACSSSLTAIHLACDSLKKGECQVAIAGGVNLYLHYSKYVMMCQVNMLSSTGKCHSFGSEGDGFVPGEGVGAVILKPLKQAIADRDHIYGVIKSSAINHGGTTSGYSVPNPNAQAALIADALKRADLNPASISYIEAHGTGTVLGDPIEVAGLTKAFREGTDRKQFCSLGSVKSNIGHGESAAGISGLTKILLQMKHRQLAPSLHAETLNPNIVFEDTPFYVQRELGDWKQPVIIANGVETTYPRRAGLSSFGAGGANAHLVVEEYVPATEEISVPDAEPCLLVLSARSEEQLQQYAQNIGEYIHRNAQAEHLSLPDATYTLQVGREPLEERLAFVAATLEELADNLLMYAQGQTESARFYTGNSKKQQATVAQAELNERIENRDWERLAELWVSGTVIDWASLHAASALRRISLPTYPFARERYWIKKASEPVAVQAAQELRVASLHPLVDANESTFDQQQFAKRITGSDPLVAQHRIADKTLLPALLQLEMARVAGELSNDQGRIAKICDVVWGRPVAVEDSLDLAISLYRNGDLTEYEVSTGNDDQLRVLSQGKLIGDNSAAGAQTESVDVSGLQHRLQTRKDGAACDQLIQQLGADLGTSSQTMRDMWLGDSEALSKLVLPADLKASVADYVLHPALLQGVWQTAQVLAVSMGHEVLYLPHQLAKAEFLNSLPSACYVHVIAAVGDAASLRTFDLRIIDEANQIVAKFKGLTLKALHRSKVMQADAASESPALLYYGSRWEADTRSQERPFAGSVLLLDTGDDVRTELEKSLQGAQVTLVKPAKEYREAGNGVFEIDPANPADYARLFEALQAQDRVPQSLLHLWLTDEQEQGVSVSSDLELGVTAIFHLLKQISSSRMRSLKRFITVYRTEEQQPNPYVEMIPAYAKSLSLAMPSLQFAAVEVRNAQTSGEIAEAVVQELNNAAAVDAEVRYAGGQRQIKKFDALTLAVRDELPLCEKGTYAITGGFGALGLIFAKHLAEKYQARLVFIGRSALDDRKAAAIDELQALGSEVLYVQGDVASYQDMSRAVELIKEKFGNLNGILHAAGFSPDKPITQKSLAEFQATLGPKVQGTVVLDEVTQAEPLDFFVLFSSSSSILGDFGQCDYALGNRFLDSYAVYREALQARGERQGRTIAINWPLWREGGMHGDTSSEEMYLKSSGMTYLENEDGLTAFRTILSSGRANVLVMTGIQQRVNKILNPQREARTAAPARRSKPAEAVKQTRAAVKREGVSIETALTSDLKQIASDVSGIPIVKLDVKANLGDFGFDSITLKDLSATLTDRFGFDVLPSVFFAHSSLHSLGEYLLADYLDDLQVIYVSSATDDVAVVEVDNSEEEIDTLEEVVAPVAYLDADDLVPLAVRFKNTSPQPPSVAAITHHKQPVAVVGISGMFPGSKSIDEFWAHLAAQKDLVTEVPSDRWDWRESFDPHKGEYNKTYSKWGGFLDDADKFDAQFFSISPREASLMDPQHRLILETVWKAIEDSGHRASDLSGRNIGLFVGGQFNDYAKNLREIREGYAQVVTGNAAPILSNRISYLLNFRGPSELIDTACSSSLVALHRAVKSIQSGESEMAVAGGVSLMLTPQTMIDASSMGMLSADGKCKTFDKSANGYVKGEGVGALLLKPLDQAIADGNPIYAVIKGTAENHGGKANSLTAPNSEAQADLLIRAYEEAGFAPDTITYMETHGTGTELGDPIEIDGLKKAFRELYKRTGKKMEQTGTCAIGSVKTNIGHLEPASGMAGVIKVLLSMKHGLLPGLVHFQELNPFIDLKGSPFELVTETKPWERRQDREGNPIPRRAGVSSFGFGGTNAHVVLEEYQNPIASRVISTGEPQLIVLSARNVDRLSAYASSLVDFLDDAKRSGLLEHEISLDQISYTLQLGREPMDERLALVVSTVDELIEKLTRFHQGDRKAEGVYHGNIKQSQEQVSLFVTGQAGEEFIRLVTSGKDYERIAQLWISGVEIDWNALHPGLLPSRVSLPTYPFARDRHWAWKTAQDAPAKVETAASVTATLHAVVDSNESTFEEQCFKKVFSGDEFYLADHGRILPGVAYLEMIRAAGNLSSRELQVKKLKNVIFANAIFVDRPLETYVGFQPDGDAVDVTVSTQPADGQKMVHAQGKVVYEHINEVQPADEVVDLAAVIGRCQGGVSGAREYYDLLDSLGAFIGPRFKGIQEFYWNEQEAISRLDVSAGLIHTLDQFVLHPVLMDGGLQTTVAYAYQTAINREMLYLPFVVGEMELVNPSLKMKYAYVTRMEGQRITEPEAINYQISYLDEAGRVVVKIKNFSIRVVPRNGNGPLNQRETADSLFFEEVWESAEVPASEVNQVLTGNVLIFDDSEAVYDALKQQRGHADGLVLVRPSAAYSKIGNGLYEINAADPQDYLRLVEDLASEQALPARVLHLWSKQRFVSDEHTVQTQVAESMYSLFYTSTALMKQKPGHKIKWLYAYACDPGEVHPSYASVSGFSKSLAQENPHYSFKVMAYPRMTNPAALVDFAVRELEAAAGDDIEIRYQDGQRQVKRLVERQPAQRTANSGVELQDQGVYLITGGTGGLGLIFAEYLSSKQAGIKLVLTGRSELDAAKQQKLAELQATGAEVLYLQADVSLRADVQLLVQQVKSRYGRINGVFHSAGVTKDAYTTNKTIADIAAVLAPKVNGTLHLAETLQGEPLDLFVLFSSISGVLGNRGQVDYSYANCFLDNYAQLLQQNMPSCKTVSINWPLWRDGGMQIDAQSEDLIWNTFGMRLLETEAGVEAFEHGIVGQLSRWMVLSGDPAKLRHMLKQEEPVRATPTTPTTPPPSVVPDSNDGGEVETVEAGNLQQHFQQDLVEIISGILDVQASGINLDGNMSEFGFDSITFTELANKINKQFGLEITPATFFSHSSPASIATTLCEDYVQTIRKHYEDQLPPAAAPQVRPETPAAQPVMAKAQPVLAKIQPVAAPARPVASVAVVPVQPACPQASVTANTLAATGRQALSNEPIAIIGMSGMMPQANNLDEYWKNLIENKDLITEIPADRWDWREYYGDPNGDDNKTNIIWGGFMKEIDKFDPLFFSISPADAETMDPQERLVIEMTWKAMESAGYRATDISGTKTGIFIGVTNADYKELMVEAKIPTAVSHCFVANRASYLLNLQGPSEVVDTACSSSLVAIHRAVEAIRLGHCEAAFAGGVNVMACPNLIIYQSKASMLSPDGKCKTFDKDANGYVRGEGVGMIMLKPLRKAEADGDPIVAVIRGTGVNHGGHASSLTAPNPNAQAALLESVYENAGIDPATVTYLEAHGTGTSLGDPIEINGMKQAFKNLYKKWNKPMPAEPHCGIGSVKTNMGHLESAAGVAGLIKIVMAMQHRIIPASIHFNELNPYIQLDGTPFKVISENSEWQQVRDERGLPVPRRGGVSSFGIGGVNGHVVIEEYQRPADHAPVADNGPQLIVLSAKNEARLKAYASDMVAFLEQQTAAEANGQRGLLQSELLQLVAQDVRTIASDLLQVEVDALDPEENWNEYGFDALALAEFAERVGTMYNIEIPSLAGSTYASLQELVEFLITEHRAAVAQQYGNRTDAATSASDMTTPVSLANLAYTLQTGREAMQERLALVVHDLEQLKSDLADFCAGTGRAAVYRGTVKRNQAKFDGPRNGKVQEELLKTFLQNGELEGVAELWVSGVEPDWKQLLRRGHVRRIALPTYPFDRVKYWLPEQEVRPQHSAYVLEAQLHPMIGKNSSTMQGQRFTTRMTGSEYFLADHVVGGKKILPGAGYLEMVRAAGELAAERQVLTLQNVLWAQPLEVGEQPLDVHVGLMPAGDQLEYEVYSTEAGGQKTVYSQGRMEFVQDEHRAPVAEFIDLAAIKQRCVRTNSGAEVYAEMNKLGLDLREGFQSVQEWFIGPSEALTRVVLPEKLRRESKQFLMHPTLLDAALQTVSGLMDTANGGGLSLPFGMDELEMTAPLVENGYAYAVPVGQDSGRNTGIRKYNIVLADETGRVLLKIKGFSTREVRQPRNEEDEILRVLKLMQAGELDALEADKLLGGVI